MQNANFKLQIAKYQRIKKKITKIISSPLAGEDEGEGEINSIIHPHPAPPLSQGEGIEV
jgi:hypothetical protein